MNTGAKPRNVSTDSLASLIATVGPPSVAELEEFAESAKGLAGLDCYEKFGRPEPHPPLGGGDDSLAEGTQADEETQAMAACLATPYTADVSLNSKPTPCCPIWIVIRSRDNMLHYEVLRQDKHHFQLQSIGAYRALRMAIALFGHFILP